MDKRAIESESRKVLRLILENQDQIWGDTPPQLIERMIDPVAAAFVLGLKVELVDELGRFGEKGDQFETAGTIDRESKLIQISRKFSREAMLFTAAHEVGHYVLHPQERKVLHRDRPVFGLDGSQASRPPLEKEADYFAACLLLPRNTVRSVFQRKFKVNIPFHFDHRVAFQLCGADYESLLFASNDSLEREMAISTTESFNGERFSCSMANHFRVSAKTMAIRLQELGLFYA